ncbi:hypothetical protein P4056_06190 [Pseudomonas aeruginosa]|nr:hypothetical protein [Pseudomonas aeruginosa]
MRDIIAQLGNQNSFHRLRLGIGHPGHSSLVSGYVLGRARAASRNCSTPASTSPSACCRKCSPGLDPGDAEAAQPEGLNHFSSACLSARDIAWDSTAASSACPTSASPPCSTP